MISMRVKARSGTILDAAGFTEEKRGERDAVDAR